MEILGGSPPGGAAVDLMGKNPAYLSPHLWTVGGLIDSGVRVIWSCQKCGAWALADLLAIKADKGADYSLVDRRAPCRVNGCGGRVHFLYGSPARPLRAARERQDAAQLHAARQQLEQARTHYNVLAPPAGAPQIPPEPWRLRR